MKKKNAFTLAEVLITLGIIGIVAAMTLPALIANYKRQEYSTRIKKFYSTLSQAIIRSEVDNGAAIYWTKANQLKDDEGKCDYGANADWNKAFIEKYILPYLKYVSAGIKKWDSNNNYETIVLTDGSEFMLHNGDCIDIIYDMNGLGKSPDKDGYDRFRFLMCFNDTKRNSFWGNKSKFFGAYGRCVNRDNALTNCKNNPITCSVLLECDGWEFKEDYPHKLW